MSRFRKQSGCFICGDYSRYAPAYHDITNERILMKTGPNPEDVPREHGQLTSCPPKSKKKLGTLTVMFTRNSRRNVKAKRKLFISRYQRMHGHPRQNTI